MARMLSEALILCVLGVPRPSESRGEEPTLIHVLYFYMMEAHAVTSLKVMM